MSLGEIQQVSEGIYAYLQPDGSWYPNSTGFLTSRDGVTLWSGVLETVLRPLGARTLVPGHGNLHRAYLELDGAERGVSIDQDQALRDMVAFSGGPLACHA